MRVKASQGPTRVRAGAQMLRMKPVARSTATGDPAQRERLRRVRGRGGGGHGRLGMVDSRFDFASLLANCLRSIDPCTSPTADGPAQFALDSAPGP